MFLLLLLLLLLLAAIPSCVRFYTGLMLGQAMLFACKTVLSALRKQQPVGLTVRLEPACFVGLLWFCIVCEVQHFICICIGVLMYVMSVWVLVERVCVYIYMCVCVYVFETFLFPKL